MNILSIIWAILGLGLLVFVHELGHYWVARRVGMIVEVFSIGFGRALCSWRWNGVKWQIGWLPFGGYVKILGMDFAKIEGKEPHELPSGFFSKSPLARIAVSLAGPFANFVLAILFLCLLWGLGGREKNFNEYNQIVGWVDPSSSLYKEGLRPGDRLSSYNGIPFRSAKDIIYASMLSGQQVIVKGESCTWPEGLWQPYQYLAKPYPAAYPNQDKKTLGIQALAQYLRFEPSMGSITSGAPLLETSIEPGDRAVWADGTYLFSGEQLSAVTNSSSAYLTVQRGEQLFHSRQPRCFAELFVPNSFLKEDFVDWQYGLGLKGTLTWILPYSWDRQNHITGALSFIDETTHQIDSYPPLDPPLQIGDRIMAVDGISVTSGPEVLSQLQTRHVTLIVQEGLDATPVHEAEATAHFFASWDPKQIEEVAATIGGPTPRMQVGPYRALIPIEPKTIFQFNLSEEQRTLLDNTIASQIHAIDELPIGKEQDQARSWLDAQYKRKVLGTWTDEKIIYNPSPWALFQQIFIETGQTLRALFTGDLHLKWMSGPVGIVQVMQQGWHLGLQEAVFWMATISINLGVLNLLPIPILDGGYVCLSLWEIITKKKLKARTMQWILMPFLFLLIGLLVFLTFQDLLRMF